MNTKLVLKDAYKRYTLDQDKIISPTETIKRFKEKLKHINLDILKETIRIDNGRLDIPVFFSVCGEDARTVIGTKKQMGKGASPDQAEASAVMELAERYSFFSFYNRSDNFIIDTFNHLKNRAIPFKLIADSVHDESDELKITRKIFENIPMKWAKAVNLTRDRELLVPFDWFYMINEFNGPSAGNCIEEALSQGICEIVERHTSSLISRNQMKAPAINVASITDQKSVEMVQKYQKNGIRLYLTDFSLDLGIPTVGALAYDPTTFPHQSEIVWTAGTTPSPHKALSRSLTEVAQLAGDFNSGSNYVASGLPKFTSLADAEYIINPGSNIDITSLPDISDDNIKTEVINCISALAEKNMEVIVLDTTHPLLEIPAFYTIIPGAHFRERAIGTSVGMFSAKLIVEKYPSGRAIDELTEFERHLPDKYYLKFFKGLCHLSLQETETALDLFQRALALGPTSEDMPSIYSYMGICLKNTGRYDDALKVLAKAATIDDQRTDVYNLMGFCYFKLKKYDKAISSFRKVLQLNPSSAIDYANIASNYRDMGQKEKAIQYYETALHLDPSIDFARKSLENLKHS